MPCSKHHHKPWPTSGQHNLLIEACETQCGWCTYSTRAKGQANNLRVHAQRHTENPKYDSLKHITIVRGSAGRSRVALRSPAAPGSLRSTSSDSPVPPRPREWDEMPHKTHESKPAPVDQSPQELPGDVDLLLSRIHALKTFLIENEQSYAAKQPNSVPSVSRSPAEASTPPHSSNTPPHQGRRESRIPMVPTQELPLFPPYPKNTRATLSTIRPIYVCNHGEFSGPCFICCSR
ncbi:hypothetical protein BU23DRAFT_327872 [Bimuria novae-zelandiae CBS 107.79]|uniref:Uncharacterized protein n=1 Tax=Bimuria novae-zelandiae CBS 107.79 TaxID=1447943 RepID=A0A6A5UNM8_9PLEO|nr:hypothetical protein BU23DRAFT_327872 [Bimuria novae-zelandiae CBS 107.79]